MCQIRGNDETQLLCFSLSSTNIISLKRPQSVPKCYCYALTTESFAVRNVSILAPRGTKRPRHPSFLKFGNQLDGTASNISTARDSSKLNQRAEVFMTQSIKSHSKSIESFRSTFGHRIDPWLLARLEQEGFEKPTVVQQKALEIALPSQGSRVGNDIVIHAQTGSGKTLAYLIPTLMAIQPSRASVQAVVIVPTQELGMQVYKLSRRLVSAYRSIGRHTNIEFPVNEFLADQTMSQSNPLSFEDQATQIQNDSISSFPVLPMVDQADFRRQKLQLRETAPRLIVGNPLRIAELVDSGRLRLDLLKVLVVDEFDACILDDRTVRALQTILSVRGREGARQTILASATVPQHRHFLRQCIRQKWTSPDIKHIWIEENSGERVPTSLKHHYAFCEGRKKLSALRALLINLNTRLLLDNGQSDEQQFLVKAIVFVMASRNVAALVDALDQSLRKKYQSKRESEQLVVGLVNNSSIVHRREAMQRFRENDARVLISTDLAARGLDVDDVSHVFHFDLPTNPDSYLHRAGRTGRQGRRGDSIVLLSPGEEFVVDRISNSLDIDFVETEN